MKSGGIPKCEIKTIPGNASEKDLDACYSGNEEQIHVISSIISGRKYIHATTVNSTSNVSRNQSIQQQFQCNSTTNSNLSFYFGIDWDQHNSPFSIQPQQLLFLLQQLQCYNKQLFHKKR